ncbi:diguanylate cyclase [Longimicrobium sp.]|uniref:diguanylate cyclase n=1 Tax=Longimicrobium sp. TaxID=2029185 RepID=UPI002C8A643F|nr:diguanylate cyclase [Longimicrobium sp.]HSU13548.1 diguanylate cyclase [Longimicrobium sp.]
MPQRVLLHHSPHGRPAPSAVREFAASQGFPVVEVLTPEEIGPRVSRTYPAALVIDATSPADDALAVCRQMKGDAFTSVVPVIMYLATGEGSDGIVAAALENGADEVLNGSGSAREVLLRLKMAVARAERDVSVHPTTLLPGTVQIQRDIAERLRGGEKFAVCYADLDHFKEFNDRYGYIHGDRVILILSRILREVVRAYSPSAFVGHIGGDDFIFNAPLGDFRMCCEEVIGVFSELIPLQYTEEDRERGFFIGKDRRGEVYQVPLMTLSIGVVTNEHRSFVHTAQISELATEMKAYAKTFPGSIYVVDRRTDRHPAEQLDEAAAAGSEAAALPVPPPAEEGELPRGMEAAAAVAPEAGAS